jgi:SpoVK/Ycf46/Vps4 family AAA+-type ATPase
LTNQDFYKISNKTMNDFQRLCWKSSWLRSNLNPYINRIQANLKKMKESQQILEANSTFQFFLGSFFGFKKSDIAQMSSWPFGKSTESKFNNKMNDLSLDWYLNYNTSFDPKVVMPSFSIFQNQENIENYNSIITKRISSIIKNVKMNLNTNGQPQAHSFIQGRRKLEKQKETSQMNEFFYNLTSGSFPLLSLNPFSSDSLGFSPINYVIDDLLIPSNQILRLRILWALNRTHSLTFKENTDIQNIWQSGKIRDQNKSNKTKKFLRKSINQLFPKNMTKLSFEKTKIVEKKLSWHRINNHFAKRIFDSQKPKLYLTTSRDLKFYLKAQSIPTFSNSRLRHNLNFSTLPRFQIEKAQKNALHFWWSTKTPFESFFPLSLRGIDSLTTNIKTSTSWSSFVIVNSLWLGALLFHLSILFSLFRIGEIRSLLKFYFLIISKISQAYFLILKMTWELLESYSARVESIFSNVQKQVFKVQSNDLVLKGQTGRNPIWLLSLNVEQNGKQARFNKLNSFAIKSNIQNSLVEQVWARFPLANIVSAKRSFILLSLTQTPFGLRPKFRLTRDSINPVLSSVEFPITSQKSVRISTKPLLFDELASFIQFPILLSAKSIFFLIDSSLAIFYQVLYKIIDFFESCIMVIYHFLEKPAELMIEWVAQVFLIEWSSDILSFFPDFFDSQIWNAFSKFSRGSRIPPILGFLLQRRLFCMTETLFETLAKPDIDLLERQKKGVLFWDIWGEILIQAAENYQMNLVSFMTLKDEQDLFMEKLLEDSKWEWSYPSMIKMRPLLNFIGKETQFSRLPSNFLTNGSTFNSTGPNFFQNKMSNVNRLFQSNKFLSILNSSNLSAKQHLDYSDSKNFSNHHWKRWSVNQSFTYQGRDTDLFVDLHPPKSFHHLSFLKSTPIAQQTLGPLVCQIYSGLFTNEIAKNILLVGSPGIAKTLFIQALAGEAELKLMTDHAQRYAGVQQGIAVGMKFLKDVFDAIALYSPCIFLLEDIHLIGEKRSMLISDQENNINNEEIFGVHQEEVHEKNQLFYHWTRHHLTHYQRPYKSDFSVGIPTNQFCFDLFFGIQPPKSRSFAPKSPLPISNIEIQISNQNVNPFEQSIESVEKIFQNQQKTSRVSSLQIPSEKTLSPPATSPFFVFALKEKQHLKPRKRVKQIPWGGFSSDQMNLLPKMAYSVRIKVALLADLAIRNLSVKLDMITDLLVILDNVRSNRGFVVFATTHMPSLLDPALRRPGRFDETISLPIYPNLLNRWEILKTNFSGFSSTCDFLDYALVTSHFNETMLLQLISETKLSLLNLPHLFPSTQNSQQSSAFELELSSIGLSVGNRRVSTISKPKPIASLNQAFQAIIEKPILLPKNRPSQLAKSLNSSNLEERSALSASAIGQGLKHSVPFTLLFSLSTKRKPIELAKSYKAKGHSYLKLNPVVLMSLTYFQIGTFFVRQNLLKNQNSYHYATWTQLHQLEKPDEFLFKQFYSPSYELKNQVTQFFSGKIAQSLIMHSSISGNSLPTKGSKAYLTSSLFPQSTVSQRFSALGGFELFWNSATAFVSALIYKRFLYQTNIVTSNLLDFDNFSLLLKPLSPPASTISMPAKKYENFQRIQRDFHQKSHLSIHDKLEMHQKQRLMKNLYKKPLETLFRSESLEGRSNTFTNSFQELGYLDSIMLKPTSVNAYYQSRMITRHKFSFIHQWWNGQLAEHNVESTFLSDVDWRSMFVRSIGDLVIDFPDAEQYYNPRQRRWFFNSSSWGYWSNFNQTFSHEISYHFMFHCYQNASNHLQQHRESLDYYAHTLLQQGMLKEMDFITVPSRFRIH